MLPSRFSMQYLQNARLSACTTILTMVVVPRKKALQYRMNYQNWLMMLVRLSRTNDEYF